MRKASLSLIFILLGVLFLQAESMTKRSNQITLSGEKSTVNILTSFGFPGLVETSSTQDKTQNIANLFAYYIDGRVLENTVSSLFYKTQTNNVLTYDQLQNVLTFEGVEKSQLDRLMSLITLDQDNMVDYSEFNRLANVIFNEALTVVTWIYMTKNPIISPTDRVNEESVEDAILKLFKKIEDLYPPPRCEEIEYLFEKVDEDGDGFLDIEEFHHLLSIFLKYYRSGIQNNDYADVIFDDSFYTHSETEGTQSSQSSQELTEETEHFFGLTESSGSSEPSGTEVSGSQESVSDEVTETVSEPTYYDDEGLTEGTQPLSPEATESTPTSSEGTGSVGKPASSQVSETQPAVTEDTFGFSYYYPKTESEQEETESTPAVTESAATESEPEVTESIPAGTEGDTYGFSYYYPSTETEATEATGSSEPEATESTPAGTDGTEIGSEPEVTESAPAGTEGDTYGFSYYYPKNEETEETKPSEPVNEPTEDEITEVTGSQRTIGDEVTEGTPYEPEATESTPAATEGDTYGFSYYYPKTEETGATEEPSEPLNEPTEDEVTEEPEVTGSQRTIGDEVTEGTPYEPEATESTPAATEGDTYGFSYYYPQTEETQATEEPSEPLSEPTEDEITEEPEVTGSQRTLADEVTEGTPSEPEATESTESTPAATEGDTYGFSYYYPKTEETQATEDEITEEPVASEPEVTESQRTIDDEVTEGTPSEPVATESTPAATEEALTESSPAATEGDTYGFSYYYPKTEEETEVTEPSAAEETGTDDEVTEPTGAAQTQEEETESEPAESSEPTQSGPVAEETEKEASEPTAKEETKADEETEKTEKSEKSEKTKKSEKSDKSDKSDDDSDESNDDNSGYSYHYSGSSGSKSKGKSSGSQKYTFGSNASSKFSYSSKRN